MTADTSAVPGSAYMLADHLDAALASGEDIISTGRRVAKASEAGANEPSALRSAVELIRALELALITRTLKAREWSQRLAKEDQRFKLVAKSFVGGTAALVDAVAEFADATEKDFHTGDGLTAYFRSRGVIDAEAPAISEANGVLIGEDFLVTGRIRLGELLDMIASFLDALEVHFLLFAPEPVKASSAGDAAPLASAQGPASAEPQGAAHGG